ncbi:MAG TPA: efflux transporter outer membrane subunit [Terracidiphilus sp.]|nr:efflux transporter outer membrane subunit [Terracidiphilus sp.]
MPAPQPERRTALSAASPAALPAAALAALLLLTGCKPVGPNYTRPAVTAPPTYSETGASAVVVPPPNPNGGAWQPASPSDGMLRGDWWQVYHDPELNRLEALVTPNNQSLRSAVESYLAARDQVAAARAGFYPTLSAGVSAGHSKLSAHRPLSSATSGSTNFNDLLLAGQAAWEPDFWGRIRRTVEAANAASQASAADAAIVDLSLHAELAQDYFELRGLDSQASLLQSTVTDYQHQLNLTEKLLANGIGTEVDVAQARTQLQTLRAQLIDVSQARAQFRHAIATLINQPAGRLTLAPAPLRQPLPSIPIGVPSQLIQRRPDVAAAERRVAEANAQIGIAISAFYPTISIGGDGGFESTHGGTWIQGPSALWSLGAQATQLLFDAGRRRALTSQARHLYEAQSAGYKATVLAAFNEVEDRLSDLRILQQESQAERLAVADAQRSLDLSHQRYQGGVTSYLEVLTAEDTLLQNQRTLTDLQTRQFAASVQLIRALGGGWDTTQLPK